MDKFKNATHYLAVILIGAIAFLESPAGQAVVKQYPHLEPALGLLTTIAALYHVPLKPQV
jgi:hypothetical protein